MMNSVMIAAQPEYNAPATKYGGNEVMCQPGCCDIAKSDATMECPDTARGIRKHAIVRYVTRHLRHWRSVPSQPSDNAVYSFLRQPGFILSRQIARSGIIPTYRNRIDELR